MLSLAYAFTTVLALAAFPLSAVASPVLAPRFSREASSLYRRAAPTCPMNSPASCPSPKGADSCCTNTPGGYFVQTQFWDTDPSTGPTNSWTVHGLWPDNCNGTYQANCDSARAYTNITQILQAGGAQSTLNYMNTYWKDYQGNDESFWEHEWAKHGTCVSTLEPSCYGSSYQPQEEVVDFFERTVALFKNLPTYTWLTNAGITPSSSATYTLAQLQAVAKNQFGQEAVWNCQSGALNEVWWGYTTMGNVQSGTFTPAAVVGSGSTCPSTGIQWLPKSSSGSSSSSSSSGATPTSSSSASGSSPTSGSSNTVNVIQGSSTNGCLISTGKWMVQTTCATYTSTTSGSGFTLKTSKGPCQVSSGVFACASGNTATVFTGDSSGNILYSGSSNFYGSATPSGTTQITVMTGSGSQNIKLQRA